MNQLRFGVQDIFRSPRIALGLQRIWIQFLGLVVGYVGYLIFTYISLVSTGIGFSYAWKRYALLPCLMPEAASWYSYIIFGIGALWLIASYLISATAVSRATYMLLKGDHFYTWRDAIRFAMKKAASVLLSPLAIGIIIGLMLGGGAIVGLLGKIPFVGVFGISIFTMVWFFAALFVVFLVIILAVATLQAPAIIATTDDDAFEAIFQSFSMVWIQPWRLILYVLLSAILADLAFFILAFLAKKAFLVMESIFGATMGDAFINISSHAMYLLNFWLIQSIAWMQSILGKFSGLIYFSRFFDPLVLPHGYQYVASYIFALSMLIIGGFIFSYAFASFNVGNTIAYIVLRKKKDNENLLERKDAEEEDTEEQADAEAQAGEETEKNAENKPSDES